MAAARGRQLSDVLDSAALEVDGVAYTWADVVAGARLRGEWEMLEEGCALGVAAERRGGAPSAGEIEEAGAQFRYERGLLSADDAEAWLGKVGVSVAEWREFLARALLRQRLAGELDPAAGRDGVEDVLWAEGVCSGALEAFAHALAARAAAAARLASGENGGGEPPRDAAALEEAFERFCANATAPDAVERELRARAMDFLRLDCDVVAVTDEDVARELALGVTADGRTLAEATAAAGAEAQRTSFQLADTDDAVRTGLLSATVGELIGPVSLGGAWYLFHVIGKHAPADDDAEVRGRAAAELLERAIAQEVDRRVRWLDPALA